MAPVVRFAPSPTGKLHVGNARPALLNWLFARRHGGTFLLRLDDTDATRSTEAFAVAIREDLRWLGLTWEREERQTARLARYADVAEQLKIAGRLYACYETEEELDRRRKRQRARGLPPIYDRAALKLTDADHARMAAEGRRPHWRFKLSNSEPSALDQPLPTLVSWIDAVRGDQAVDIGSLSDPVLVRADGTFLYTFTSVVDDVDFAITHVIRGEDHVTNTGVQINLFEALGAALPVFAHHSLLVDRNGDALSKRDGALSLESLREDGIEPMAVASLVALTGTSDAITPHLRLDELASSFELEKLSRAPGRFDPDELLALNGRLLHMTPYPAVTERLASQGIGGGEAFWLAVRPNLRRVSDAAGWWACVAGPIAPVIENGTLTTRAAGLLPAPPWSEQTWGEWTAEIQRETGTKGRALFHPLRLALTAREHGPELKALLPLIGPDKTSRRLRGETA